MTPKTCSVCGEHHSSSGSLDCRNERDAFVIRARAQYGSDEIEVDDDAKLSHGDDGTWVQAWVWLER